MARIISTDFPMIISVLHGLSLKERLKGLEALGNGNLREGEVLGDTQGEYNARLYELENEPGENSSRFAIPVDELDEIDGYKPSNICQLLAFREINPDLQLKKSIWAPGESFVRGGTQTIGLAEIRNAKGGIITSTERVERAYGNLTHRSHQGTKHSCFTLSQFCWVHNESALFMKRI